MNLTTLTFKLIRRIVSDITLRMDKLKTSFLFHVNDVKIDQGFLSKGVPQIHVSKGGRLEIGSNFRMNNGLKYNRIGRQQPCQLIVGEGASLIIGNDVGMSSSTLCCKNRITLGDRVKIGGNVVIYDTDFHSLDAAQRANAAVDETNRNDKPVIIGDDVFIGAHSTILKGVRIGNKSIVGACSVVTRDIPENEIWAGNPAKFIRKVQSGNMSKVA